MEFLAASEPFHRLVRLIADSSFSPSRDMDSTQAVYLKIVSSQVWAMYAFNAGWASDEQLQRMKQDAAELTRIFKTAIRKLGMHVRYVVDVWLYPSPNYCVL